MPTTKIFGHRGAMGHYPENTMLGFNKAQEMGADGIEIDVHLTKDKQVVVMHDENVDRTTTGKGLIKNWKIFELKKVSTGMHFKKLPKYNETWHKERVPELFEVLALVANNDMVINIELKTDVHDYPGIEREVHHVVASHGMKERVVFSSFNLETLKRLKKHDSNVKVAYLSNELPENYEEMIDKYDLEAIHLNVKSAFENIELMKEKGIFFRIWTVNDREQMQQLINAGVRGIITDYPDTALDIKEQ